MPTEIPTEIPTENPIIITGNVKTTVIEPTEISIEIITISYHFRN